MERVADPTVVAALFSMILAMRNRLHAMGHVSLMMFESVVTLSDAFHDLGCSQGPLPRSLRVREVPHKLFSRQGSASARTFAFPHAVQYASQPLTVHGHGAARTDYLPLADCH